MPFELVSTKNSSDPEKEYVLLRATSDTNNLENYAIVDKTFTSSGNQSNKYRHIFIFPNFPVKKGEYVVLWTGSGKQNSGKNSDGEMLHHFYWNSDECVWNNSGDIAYLIKFEHKGKIAVNPVK